MNSEYGSILNKAKSKRKQIKKRLANLKSQKPGTVDEWFHHKHEEAFSHINCLECANCCKTTGPKFLPSDIKRISKYLGMKSAAFETDYLRTDEDGDKVLQSVPCPFLEKDNKCGIYETRPKACRSYPHTDEHKVVNILNETYHNALICPAVAWMVDQME